MFFQFLVLKFFEYVTCMHLYIFSVYLTVWHAVIGLKEFRGNLHEAVNAYFSEEHRHNVNQTIVESPRYNVFDMNNRTQAGPSRFLQLLSAARTFKPSSLLDNNYRRSLLNGFGASSFTSHAPVVPHTGEVMGTPVEFNNGNQQLYHPGGRSSPYDSRTSSSHGLDVQGNVLQDDVPHLHGNNVEEEMIQAALEASKRDAEEGHLNTVLEDDELSHAVSLSLKTAEQENAMREQAMRNLDQQLGILNEVDHFQRNKDALPSNEWGGISSTELDEAIMLEAALFGEKAEGTSHRSKYEPHQQSGPDRSMGPSSWPLSDASSSSVTQHRLLREQQDNEYVASLLADKEKEAIALKQAESLRLKEDESQKKLLEEEKLERWLAMKETLLPPEPASNDGNAVTLLVKMPDATRCSRRFLKSDKLKFLFDFIDVGRTVKPGTYRVVRPYPRRAFNVSDGSLSLTEAGLTSKQEALFLELI
ncbi:hypothetical protein EZV62_009790 [Acer yangbiense]|uniref:UBX domain-containing protein n=1 Tax=Acer yangbiense TaxID=1000413 RepID=A0A5C7I274_9ROSI|nr:hypothetical protein EZV62_009790 [Acer yangbiense]